MRETWLLLAADLQNLFWPILVPRVPIVLLMFLYEARARARLVQKHHQHNWEPILA